VDPPLAQSLKSETNPESRTVMEVHVMRKRWTGSLLILVSLFLPVAVPAEGGEDELGIFTGSREVRLAHGALFNGKVLAEGTYHLMWGMNRDRERVEVRLFQGKRMVATVGGRLAERDAASPYDSVVFTRSRIGERELSEIRFAGSRSVISLIDDSAALAGSR
jgi:hypothetical protein